MNLFRALLLLLSLYPILGLLAAGVIQIRDHRSR